MLVQVQRFQTAAALALVLSGAPLLSPSLRAQEVRNEGPIPTTALISVESKNELKLDPTLLKLEVNGHASAITAIRPIQPAATQVAILIDDGLRSSFGLQLSDFAKFITELPAGTQVMIGYMQNGGVRAEGGFTTDHAAVARSLRIPLSSAGISASPYFCLSEFVKHWPSNEPGARIVLMITNGVDPYNGSTSPLNQNSPYVQSAQDDVQRAGAAVYSIYYGDRGTGGRLSSFSGQSYLNQIAEATGGRSFYQGTLTPPSFAPYLAQFRRAIAESYQIAFDASATREKRNTLTYIKLKSSQNGIRLHTPFAVHPGVDEVAAQ